MNDAVGYSNVKENERRLYREAYPQFNELVFGNLWHLGSHTYNAVFDQDQRKF